MEDMKGAWYGKMRSFSHEHDADARKAMEEERELFGSAADKKLGKADSLQKRVDMDLFK